MSEAAPSPPAPSSGVARAVLAAIGALYLAHCIATDFLVDDCFITFRYVRNWVDGLGPVFNPGERVEGYTNFLWTALLALVHAAWRSLDLVTAARALSYAAGLATLWLVGRMARERFGAGRLWWFAPLFLALHAPFVAWSTAGLETTLFTALVTGAIAAEPRTNAGGMRAWASPLLLALATMTRPDGIVFVAALLLWRALPRAGGAWPRSAMRPVVAFAALFALVYGPYWVWRWQYYGWPLPNTFYAKVGGGRAQLVRGCEYVVSFFRVYGAWLLVLAVAGLVRIQREPAGRLAFLAIAACVAYVIAVGGESLGFFRFLVPIAPLIALLAAAGLSHLSRRGARMGSGSRTKAAVAMGGLVVLLGSATLFASARPTLGPTLFPERHRKENAGAGLSFPGLGSDHSFRWFDNYFVARLAAAARWLDANAPADALVASSPAGSIGYHMRQPLLDMLGLNDEWIAHVEVPGMGRGRAGHEKGDGAYVLARRPRYVLLGNVAVFDHPLEPAEIESRCARLVSERQLFADPGFHRLYERKSVRLGDDGPFQWFTFYERRGP